MSASTWYVITAKCYTWVNIFPRYSLSASIFIGRLCLKKVSTISYSLNSLFLRIRKNIHSIALHCPPMILSTAVYFQLCHSCGTATPATPATPATAPHSGPCHSRWDEKPRQPAARGWGPELTTKFRGSFTIFRESHYLCINTYESDKILPVEKCPNFRWSHHVQNTCLA